jgi:hypothetical protein
MTPNKQRALVTSLILFGMLAVGFFGLRTFHAFREFHGHRPSPPFENEQPETDVQLIRDWMTVPFIARMYHVPPSILFEALDIPKNKTNEEQSLKQLNEEYFPNTNGFVEATVKAAVLAHLPAPMPTAPSPPTP